MKKYRVKKKLEIKIKKEFNRCLKQDKRPALDSIIKHIKPFVKFNRGVTFPVNLGKLDLSKCKYVYRDNAKFSGVSTHTYSDKWFIVNGKQALYKTYDGASYSYAKEFRTTNEVLCYELAKQLNIPCVSYQFAHLENTNGTITYNALKEKQTIVPFVHIISNLSDLEKFHDFTYYRDGILNFAKMNNIKVDIEKVLFRIYQIIIFDMLTFQTDRNLSNISFIIETDKNKNKTLKVFPLFDSEFAFGVFALVDDNEKVDLSRWEFLKRYENYSTKIGFNKFNNGYLANLGGAVYLASKNPKYAEFLINVANNFNIKEVLSQMEADGVKFSKQQKQLYITLCSYSKKCLQEELKFQMITSNNK